MYKNCEDRGWEGLIADPAPVVKVIRVLGDNNMDGLSVSPKEVPLAPWGIVLHILSFSTIVDRVDFT